MTVIKVLYVDDEENNLSSFKANFRRLYEIYTANSGAGALDILSQTEVHVVISDQRMPEMTGWNCLRGLKTISRTYQDIAYRLHRHRSAGRCHKRRRYLPLHYKAMERN
ncbi:response regulator [Niabella sp. W65]|nr:response regulator [Niabella sp. W65]MCH7368677.1 response regulator [Niabella sp. W65]